MDGWNTTFLLGFGLFFQGLLLLVSGRVILGERGAQNGGNANIEF